MLGTINMKKLKQFWVKACVSRVDTHVYFKGKIFYSWEGDNLRREVDLIPQCGIAIECFQELVKRKIIFDIEKVENQKFFRESTFSELKEFVKKHSQVLFSSDEEFKPSEHLFFQINIHLIKTEEIIFDLLFLGYKYPFQNIRMPIEVFHEFIDRLRPKVRINTIHGGKRLKIFIAHASEDKEIVRKLANDLIDRGLLVWFDEWEIKVGDSLVEKINQGIENSSFMAIGLSKNSIQKPWVNKEINAGFMKELNDRGVYLLPLLLEDCKIPPLLSDKKYANFSVSYEDGLTELLESL